MTGHIVRGLLGVLAGLVLGLVQKKLLERVLPERGHIRAPGLFALKFLLWAAAIGLGMLVNVKFMLAMVGTALVLYLVSAILWYHKSRREE